MKLSGRICVQFNARDYIEAGEHQQRLEEYLSLLQGAYPGASLSVRECRLSPRRPAARPSGRAAVSGALNDYEE